MAGGEISEVAAALPPWLQWGANAAIFVIAAGGMVLGVIKGSRSSENPKSEKDLVPHEDPMARGEIKRALADISTIADTSRIIAESMKALSLAAASMAETMNADYDQRRINRSVEEQVEHRLENERRLRRVRAEGKSPESAALFD